MGLKSRIEALEAEAEQRQRLARRPPILPFAEWLEDVTPSFSWDWPHIVCIREHLDRVTAAEIRKLMIFVPPRHGKSELTTVRYPAWRLERKPATRVIIGCYNSTLAEKFGRKARRICAERIALSGDRKAISDWETEAGGGLRAVGVGSGVTGQGGDLIIVDDPIKSREEANSEAYRDRVWTWWTDDLYTRLEPDAVIVLILTRWHMDDLAGRILASEDGPNWTVVSLPALADANDPLGRVEGEALCPERFDEEDLAEIKAVQGSSFEALYQQRPSALEGAIFKRDWWRTYREPPRFRRIVQSWDTAFKTGHDNDFSVCTTWGEADAGWYLIDRWKRRVEFPVLKETASTLGEQFHPNVVLVEDKASGQSLIQELKRDTRLPILAIKVDSDKVSRAYAVTPSIETGRVFLPESAPWLADYLDNMAAFPNAAYDDDVDSTTQALHYMIIGGAGMGIFEYYRRLAAGEIQRASVPEAREPETICLRVPPGIGGFMVGGTMLKPDAAGTIRVSPEHVNALLAAGYTRVDAPAAAAVGAQN